MHSVLILLKLADLYLKLSKVSLAAGGHGGVEQRKVAR
jgi:hypothetical protein